jgi:hypothetical protein
MKGSTPAASTNLSFIINCLQTHAKFRTIIFCGGGLTVGLLSRFSFSPIKNQSNDRLLLPGIAGKKWMLGFRTTILGRIYHNFLFAD